MASTTVQQSSEVISAHVFDYYRVNNTASISALTIAGLVLGSSTIGAQALFGKYFLPFFNALDVIVVNCLMLFATTI